MCTLWFLFPLLESLNMQSNELTEIIIGAAIEVHRELGPGLLESAYEKCLARELHMRNIQVELQKPVPVIYKGVQLDCGYRIDMLVQNQVLLELKAVDTVTNIHEAQILTYMRLSNVSLGLLINFNVRMLKSGIKRFIL